MSLSWQIGGGAKLLCSRHPVCNRVCVTDILYVTECVTVILYV